MSNPVVSLKTYAITFLVLMALLGLTVGVAYLDLGRLNLPAALAIAIGKAVLIILFFMHLRASRRLTWVFAGAGFFWLAIMLALAMMDYVTRELPL